MGRAKLHKVLAHYQGLVRGFKRTPYLLSQSGWNLRCGSIGKVLYFDAALACRKRPQSFELVDY